CLQLRRYDAQFINKGLQGERSLRNAKPRRQRHGAPPLEPPHRASITTHDSLLVQADRLQPDGAAAFYSTGRDRSAAEPPATPAAARPCRPPRPRRTAAASHCPPPLTAPSATGPTCRAPPPSAPPASVVCNPG